LPQYGRLRGLQNATVLDQTRLQHAAHLDALRRFARRKKISEDLVVAVYESERHRLTAGAKVERFVDVLAEKRAKRALREMKR
jgi:hypothetical protein